MALPSPFVYWAQDKSNIFLKIDLKDAKNSDINIDAQSILFSALGTGAQGTKEYSFSLQFFDKVNPDQKSINIKDSSVNIRLVKEKPAWWSRVLSTPQKPSWLKIDFDKWQSEEDLEEKVNDVRDDYPDIYNMLQKNELGYLKEDFKEVYLVLYNFLMLCGFTYVFFVMVNIAIKSALQINRELEVWSINTHFCHMMCILHMFQCLEIMHPIFGYVKGGPFFPMMQIGGRLLILFGNLQFQPKLQKMPVTTYLFLVWTINDIIRYSYYIVNRADSTRVFIKKYLLPPLKWLRYSAWIILYPFGFTCEAVIIFRNMIYLHSNPRGSITMPNKYNFTFDYLTFLRIYLLLFMAPGMYVLMKHMYNRRLRKLGGKEQFDKIDPFKWKVN